MKFVSNFNYLVVADGNFMSVFDIATGRGNMDQRVEDIGEPRTIRVSAYYAAFHVNVLPGSRQLVAIRCS